MAWCRAWRFASATSRACGAIRAPVSFIPSSPIPASPALGSQFHHAGAHSSELSKVGGLWMGVKKRWLSSQAWVEVPSGGLVEVPLAQTGEGIAECELLQWFVQEGDQVEEFQRLCEVQSDKATIEITSRFKGKVHQIIFIPGDIVKVGETLLKILVEENCSALTSEDLNSESSVSSGVCESHSSSSVVSEEAVSGVLSTPPVRHIAKQYGLDIKDISGTGKDGRVLAEDVLKYAAIKGIHVESPSFPQASADARVLLKEEKALHKGAIEQMHYEDKRIPLRGFQRAMVNSMSMAAKVPHFHYLEEINCDSLMKLKATFQKENTDPDIKHTFMPFFVKSLSMAVNKYPLLNSSFSEESNEVVLKGCHNIGVAMATPYGLVVPNIKQAQSLSILEITKELSRLQQLASNNKLSTEDITGGTITLSNIGAIGGKFGSPLLNLPEVAIIAIGRIQKLPRFADDGTVYPASVTNVTIGADHRVIDGATVARFCNEWKLLIEKPELLLLQVR